MHNFGITFGIALVYALHVKKWVKSVSIICHTLVVFVAGPAQRIKEL